MNRPLPSVRSSLPHCGPLVRWLPLSVAALCLFACGEDSEPPQACGSISQQTLGLGQEVRLMPCFEDPEGEELKLSASSSDVKIATAAASDSAIRVKGIALGSATITVVATDPAGQTGQQEVDVVVLNNRPPEVCGTVPPLTLFVQHTSLIQPCFDDPDGDSLELSASSSDVDVATVSILGSAARIKAISAGSATITLVATDPGGLTASLDIEVTVQVQ